jgi:hypothetical protein
VAYQTPESGTLPDQRGAATRKSWLRRPEDVIAVTSDKELPRQFDPATRPMSLAGMEAVELYVAQIEHNLETLAEQAVLLNKALAERTELVCVIAACLAEQDRLLREIELTRTFVRQIA